MESAGLSLINMGRSGYDISDISMPPRPKPVNEPK